MPTTIGRNRRQLLINIRNEYTECWRRNPATGTLDRCSEQEAWELLATDKRARLLESDDRTHYTIRNSTDHYELYKPAQ